jgi:two-component system chemotaxis response regulator CheY
LRTVLVVDDSTTMRRMIKAALRPLADVDVAEAASGLEAIERLSVAPVDAVILDLNMPDMHGLEVLGFIRGHQSLRSIPVAILTTRGDEDSRAAAAVAGASAYLTKPFQGATFAPAIARLLGEEPT